MYKFIRFFFFAILCFLLLQVVSPGPQSSELPLILHCQKNGLVDGDHFGWPLSSIGDVNGDGKADFIVGAPDAQPSLGFIFAGSAYIYSGADCSLLYQKNGDSSYDSFGSSVAGAGDVNGDGTPDFIIAGGGSAYVYSGTTGNLIYQKDSTGGPVAGIGDLNGDNHSDFIVGGFNSVFVYSGATGALLYQKDADSTDFNYGFSVAGAGDVNGDSIPDFIVGSIGGLPDSLGFLSGGVVYVYSGASGAVLHKMTHYYGFGFSVSSIGDINLDGKDDFIVGNPWGPLSPPVTGSVFVFSGATGSLLCQKDGAFGDDWFGASVSSAGDVNGDGIPDFIVGAPFVDSGGLSDVGEVYIYSGTNCGLLWKRKGSDSLDNLGSVSYAGDLNGDGKTGIIIGAPGADPSGLTDAGSVYVYDPVITDVQEDKSNRPMKFGLSQNYPNPFNPITTIQFFLIKSQRITLEIFNVAGQRVKTLLEGEQSAGAHTFGWNGTDEKGNILSSGVYFYHLKGEGFSETKKMIFLK